jgi:hypothetical protein
MSKVSNALPLTIPLNIPAYWTSIGRQSRPSPLSNCLMGRDVRHLIPTGLALFRSAAGSLESLKKE